MLFHSIVIVERWSLQVAEAPREGMFQTGEPETEEEVASMEILRPPPRELWWQVAEACDYATFFQSPLWTEMVCETHHPLKNATVGAILPSGTRLILPLVQAPAAKGLLRALQSTWDWSPGGVVADGPVDARDLAAVYQSLQSRRLGEAVLNGNPHSPLQDPPHQKGWEVREEFTQTLPLSGDLDDIIRGYSSAHRRGLKSAQRAGVNVRKGCTIEDFEAYYQAYQASHDRWNATWGPPHPWELFANCHQTSLRHPDKLTLWLAELDGTLLSGGIFLYWNRGVVYWHGAGHKEYFRFYPNNLLHTEVIRDAISRGLSWYDFNPSAGQEGVARFKSGFGAGKKTFLRTLYSSRMLSTIRAFGVWRTKRV